MNEVIGLMRRGDIQDLAKKAKIHPNALTRILYGKADIASYPSFPPVLLEFISMRDKEMEGEAEVLVKAGELYKKLAIAPPSDEDLMIKNLNPSSLDRMSREELLIVVERKKLDTKVKDYKVDETEELREAIAEGLGYG